MFEQNNNESFSQLVKDHIEKYLSLHEDGVIPNAVYDMIISEVERSLFEVIMKHCDWNQVKASKVLGISRNTLRKKIEILNIEKIENSDV